MSVCAVRGCDSRAATGTRLCSEHLEQAQIAHQETKSVAKAAADEAKSGSPYDILVANFTHKIGNSEQMKKLTHNLIEGGVRDAVDSFPDLAVIPQNVVEQLVSFMAVNIVSAVIQERAHLLGRASMVAEALPKSQAVGLRKMVEMEMEFVENKDEKQP